MIPRPHLTEMGNVTKSGNPLFVLRPILTAETTVISKLSRCKQHIYGQYMGRTRYVVRLIQCAKCHKQYVSLTIRSLTQRPGRHLQVISQKGCISGDGNTHRDMKSNRLPKGALIWNHGRLINGSSPQRPCGFNVWH